MFKNFLSLAIVYLFGFIAVAHAQKTYNIKDLNEDEINDVPYLTTKEGTSVTGVVNQYYESGALEIEENYKDGKKEGIAKEYYENGKLKTESNWKNGKENGIHKEYYENGALESEQNYIDGKADGVIELYYESEPQMVYANSGTNVTASGEIMVPDISEFMTTCYRKIKNITQVVVPGWRLQKLKCNDEVVTILWKKENGRIAWLEKALEEANIDISDISSLGDTVTSTIPFGVVHTVKTSPEYTSDELNNIIYDLNQSSGLNIVLNDKNITESGYINFNIVSKSAPLVWIELLSRFSGGFVKNIEYDSDTNNWEYSGGFYVKNVPPDDLSKYYD